MQNKSNQKKKKVGKNLYQNTKVNMFIWDGRITNGCFSFFFFFSFCLSTFYRFPGVRIDELLIFNGLALFKTKVLNRRLQSLKA